LKAQNLNEKRRRRDEMRMIRDRIYRLEVANKQTQVKRCGRKE
jgi:hypothetical protein